ncbi:uncharacterized protein LOC119569432 [Penaeus monodon]|uniref:uncharacterized protein LOC119569432 n=1 Tax=Penaeus monodon TaxID=6687 RepID=UPI0018A6DB4F|nr:uncharacterized protein LOC119569432 [Penaeus monodon]
MKQRVNIPTKRLPGLETMVHCETMDVAENILKGSSPNMSKQEKQTLKDLAQNPDLVIKKADKDGALVVLKRESYIAMGEAHLLDKETYIPIDNPNEALQAIKRESKILVNRFYTLDNAGKDCMNRRSFLAGQRDALLEHDPTVPHWYILPKTHKKKDPDTGLWPGRPVLSGCNAPTRPVDRLLTTYLTPLLELLPERLQDTTTFFTENKHTPKEEASWVVANFYEKNFAFVKEKLKMEYNIIAPPPYLIKEGIDHVLQGTLLRFNNHFYNQGKGTAIGASVSVAIAEIFVHASIEERRRKLEKQPAIFYRYIDDIFGIFTGTEAELMEYHQELNKIHPDLKFTLEYSQKELPFLDTMVYLDAEVSALPIMPSSKPKKILTLLSGTENQKNKRVLNYSLKEIWEWVVENAKGTPWEKKFTASHPMIAWRKGKTIADHLVRAEFPRPLKNK